MRGLAVWVARRDGRQLGCMFFFSSRRRHTRFDCDWSSDVCSSDLVQDDIAGVLNLPQPAGFLVQRVAEGSPAWRLGIKPGALRVSIQGRELLLGGDIILSVNGIGILESGASLDKIYESIRDLKPGERIVTKVLRAGQVIELSTMI